MRSLEEQSDHELLSTIGRAQAILSQRQRDRGRAFQRHMAEIEAAAWPSGCIKPNSCSRHRQCMYAGSVEQCRHFGQGLTKAVEAAVRARANDERAQRENAKRSSPKDASVVGEAEAPTPLPDSRSENTGGRGESA